MDYFSDHLNKDKTISGLDSRIKLIFAVISIIMVITYKGFAFLAVVQLINLLLCVRMRIPYKLVVERFLESAFIIIMIVLLKTFFSGEVVFFSIKVFGLEIIGHKDGLLNGVLIGGRVISAVSVLVVLGFSMPFTQFIAALSWFKIPKGFLEILMFAGKYIFVIREEAEVIYGAQKNRLGYSNLKRSLNSFGVLAGSLTLKAFDHSQNSVAAMVQRGYNGNIPLSKHKPFKVAEVVGLLFCVTVMGLVWMV